jgi:CRISPR-associated exonuclease Cas4
MNSLTSALICLLLAVLLFLVARRLRLRLGLPAGRQVYTDTHLWRRVVKSLYDPGLGIAGKPDYLIQQHGVLIPVEVKTGRTPPQPYESHRLQLAFYCLLVDRTYGKRPPYGVLHYPGRDFTVDFTPRLEAELVRLLAEMRSTERQFEVSRSHREPRRCLNCGYRGECDQRLD